MEKNKQKSEVAALRFHVKTQAVNLLLDGKTPAYEKRFKSWAKNTDGEHLHNMADAILSSTAYAMVTGSATKIAPNVNVDFLRGQTNGILMVLDIIKTYASETGEVTSEDEEYATLADMLG
jgi:predicted component of viral defense system (DUF524 family)